MRWVCAFALIVLPTSAAVAQAPHADWKTLETEHFRVHYPVTHEAWARQAAAKLETVRERVGDAVGYQPPEIIDVIISDPIAEANGSAWPLLGWPRMVLWTNPPGPSSVIGHYRNWPELLLVHEQTHLAHLLRPSRSPFRRVLARILPVGPIGLAAPRWVTEGYATMIEGQLTGSGRPHGTFRAAILRRWAQLGRLPTYDQMSSDSQNWLGTSMAYLMGSAYLEWLAVRTGPQAMKHLWARMSALESRSFDAAFIGVFGETPRHLYGRFTAELTERAMRVQRQSEQESGGQLWQDLTWATEAPDVTGDGKKLVTVLRARRKPARLVVFSTEPDSKAERRDQERGDKQRKLDPDDVPAVRVAPLPKKPIHELSTRDGSEPYSPRWMPDGDSILFVRFEPDAEGFLHPDLFRWNVLTQDLDRVTVLADVRDADPSPDGSWAVAVRQQSGLSELVRVDLHSGNVEALTPSEADTAYSHPVVAPDGKRIAFVRHAEGRWRLVIRDLANLEENEISTGDADVVAHPAWSSDGRTLYFTIGQGGFLEVHRVDVEKDRIEQVTRSHGGSLAPTVAPGGLLYFLGLDADGFDLRRLELRDSAFKATSVDPSLAPAIALAPPINPPAIAPSPIPAARDYGMGRQEWFPLVGGTKSPSASTLELGMRRGDVIGRLDSILVGAISAENGPSGATFAASWRRWPVAISAQGYIADELRDGESIRDRSGLELAANWSRRWRASELAIRTGVFRERVQASESIDRSVAYGNVSFARQPSVGQWHFPHMIEVRSQIGRTDEANWNRRIVSISAGLEHTSEAVRFHYRRGSSDSGSITLDQFSLGGLRSTLLPDAVTADRILVPALAQETAVGDGFETQRAELRTRALPISLFFERNRLSTRAMDWGDWVRLVGSELDIRSKPIPLLRLPAVALRVGVARVLDDPRKETTSGWLNLLWRP